MTLVDLNTLYWIGVAPVGVKTEPPIISEHSASPDSIPLFTTTITTKTQTNTEQQMQLEWYSYGLERVY